MGRPAGASDAAAAVAPGLRESGAHWFQANFAKMAVIPFPIQVAPPLVRTCPCRWTGAMPDCLPASRIVQEESALQSESRVSSATVSSAGQSARSGQAARRKAAMPAENAETTVRVYFDVNSHSIGDEYVGLIREQALRFNRATSGSLIVSGQSNPVDGVESAVRLSMDRTQAVATLLESFGVQSHRIVCVSRGAEPQADETSAAARRETRCVEIRHGALAPRQPVWSQRTRKTGRR